MGEWSSLSDLLDKVQSHSTVTGKVRPTALLIPRITVPGAGIDKVWGNEQPGTIRNTKTPGRKNVRHDEAFPISHMRLRAPQILPVSTPNLIHLGHAPHVIHKENKPRELRQKQADRKGIKLPKYTDDHGKVQIKGSLLRSYFITLFFTILLEVAFIVGQYYLYGPAMNPLIECKRNPRPLDVHCFMPRPTEKTTLITSTLVVACVSPALNVGEISHLIGHRNKSRDTSARLPARDAPELLSKTTFC